MSDSAVVAIGLLLTVFIYFKAGKKNIWIGTHNFLFSAASVILLWGSLTKVEVSPVIEQLVFFLFSVSFIPLFFWFKRMKEI